MHRTHVVPLTLWRRAWRNWHRQLARPSRLPAGQPENPPRIRPKIRHPPASRRAAVRAAGCRENQGAPLIRRGSTHTASSTVIVSSCNEPTLDLRRTTTIASSKPKPTVASSRSRPVPPLKPSMPRHVAQPDRTGQPQATVSAVGFRVHVMGNSGSGKTTLAARLAKALDADLVELDALNWERGWVALNESDPEELERRFCAATGGERWVTAGSYTGLCQRAFWPRLDSIVWLDLPMRICVWRLLRRTWQRWRSRECSRSGARTICSCGPSRNMPASGTPCLPTWPIPGGPTSASYG